ncbi:hypothetical protein E1176_15015 [Fulvivirga sp. RKSG066]|uniref:DUF7009 family protein n=1 Tax=Fulvivirga aurantia TaxID=2529383 RepID=UPI0012BBF6F8|nr:hypothetical protein [Fulvivirga aurantia]MTI22341.1 hypothetical protein [Fulvivirga aurantia]
MKIRIKGNSLRLRLSQSEVEEFVSDQIVSDSISFGNNQLIYALQAEERENIAAKYDNHFITVCVPQSLASTWATTDQVSLREEFLLNDSEKLSILIEKDFQCLKPRSGEDESDLYANPLAEKS